MAKHRHSRGRALRRRYGRAELGGAFWDIHIYNPRTQTTSTKRHVHFDGVSSSMSDARAVITYASKKFGKKQEYILAVPSKG